MLADRGTRRASGRSADRRMARAVPGVLIAAVLIAGCGGNKHTGASEAGLTASRANAAMKRMIAPLSAYRGPSRGPQAQPSAPVVFVAADLTDGGIAAVARGVQQAAGKIGWHLVILNGGANSIGESAALLEALRMRPGGIILGGVDAASVRRALRLARKRGIPVVGWHSAARPGPDPRLGLFDNVTSDPAEVGRLAADVAIAGSNGTAGVAIYTDPEYALDTATAAAMASQIRKCPHCTVLQMVTETPVATAATATIDSVEYLLQRFHSRWDYLLAVNGAYVTGASVALSGEGRGGAQPPFSVVGGEGDEAEFTRIRADSYQQASVAEPLNLEGWQLIDELNRADAHQPPSGYVAPPRLITRSNVPRGEVFDPASGYRQNYLRIWGR